MAGGITARIHPHWAGGKLLVERSRDPEFDAARTLVAKGITASARYPRP
jgi:hypothetical protein